MIGSTLRKELAGLWTSPVPYVTSALVSLTAAVLFLDTLRARDQAVFQPLVPLAGFLVLAVAPALCMRSFAEEANRGTLDVLLVTRVRPLQLVVAKWLAATATLVAVMAPLGVHAVLLIWWGEPDTAPMITGAAGLLLLACAASAVGIAASALTRSLPLAALGAFVITLLGWFAQPSPASTALRTLSARVSISERVRAFAGGAVDTGAVAFFLFLVGAGLMVAWAAVARRRPGARPGWVVTVAATGLVLLAALQTWVDDHSRLIDLTSGNSLSLSDETARLLADLPERLRITAFLADDQPGRVEAVALLDRYERASRKVATRVVDPLDQPGEMRRLGVDPTLGGVALELAGEVELAPAATEQDLTTAVARLRRGALPRVCISAGHGELDATSTLGNGFSRAVDVMSDNGYEVGTIDLLAVPSVPPECGAVVVAGPASPLGPATEALRRWHDDDGRLLVLAEPGFDTHLEGLLRGTGLRLTGGTVAEGDPGSVMEGDATAPLIRRYGSANPVVRNLPPTFLVGSGGIEVEPDDVPGRTVNRLADTSESSLLLDDPLAAEATAQPGPITVMAAVDQSANVDGTVHRSRLVLVADVDLLSNAFIDQAGNARFLVQALDWLTVDDSLVSITSNLAEPRPLELTDARRTYALLLAGGILPGLVLVAGAVVWALRRSD